MCAALPCNGPKNGMCTTFTNSITSLNSEWRSFLSIFYNSHLPLRNQKWWSNNNTWIICSSLSHQARHIPQHKAPSIPQASTTSLPASPHHVPIVIPSPTGQQKNYQPSLQVPSTRPTAPSSTRTDNLVSTPPSPIPSSERGVFQDNHLTWISSR